MGKLRGYSPTAQVSTRTATKDRKMSVPMDRSRTASGAAMVQESVRVRSEAQEHKSPLGLIAAQTILGGGWFAADVHDTWKSR